MSKPSWLESPIPTSATPRTDRATFGPVVAETARVLRAPLMGWQALVADRGLEHDAGRVVARTVDVSVDRQAGKSHLVLAVAVWRMLAVPGSLLTYTSASRLAARRKLLRVWWPLVKRSPLADRFRVTRGTGSESLECRNDSALILLSGDETSGHGDSVDTAFLDECWSLTEAAEQAVRPAMLARSNGQLWRLSTAGTRRSVYWRQIVEAGRTAAGLGVTEGSCFVEWAAAVDLDVTDPATWPTFMPALGRTISPATVAADLASMPLAEWRRACANQWPDETDDAGWQVISRDVWVAARL
jgi:phage terminase large subunit-like protein